MSFFFGLNVRTVLSLRVCIVVLAGRRLPGGRGVASRLLLRRAFCCQARRTGCPRMTPMQHTLPSAPMPKRGHSGGVVLYSLAMSDLGASGNRGPRYAAGPGSGAQPYLGPGSGAQPYLGPGSGAQPAAGRDPARGYPPRAPREPSRDLAREPSREPARSYPETDWLVPGLDLSGDTHTTPPDRNSRLRRGGGGRARGSGTYGADGGGGRRGGRGRRGLVLGAIGIVVLAGGGAAGYKVLHKTSAAPTLTAIPHLPTSDPTAQSTYYLPKLGKWQHIGTRKLDPSPLSVTELYPPAFGLAGKQYQRAVFSMDQSCGLAVIGSQLQAAFQSGDCSQVVRATYVSGDQKVMGTIGVINLSSAYWSEQAAKVANGTDELIAPLAASKGATKTILNGTG